MLTNLGSIKFIGDLSLQDADILAKYGKQSKCILEFGVGGSTQILAQCGAGTVISVETSQEWVGLTRRRLAQLTDKTSVIFRHYYELESTLKYQQYDLIFVDGVDNLRGDFAHKSWAYLKPQGKMIFHGTRRGHDFANVMSLESVYYNEIEQIDVNARASNHKSSNMTVIHKKELEPYENWNLTENKPAWAYGAVPGTEDAPLWSQDGKNTT